MANTNKPRGLEEGRHQVVKLVLPNKDKSIKITMYHTPHNNQVYFKVENTKKSAKSYISATAVTEGDISQLHRIRAASYANNVMLLKSKQHDPMFLEACKSVGVRYENLLPKEKEDFAHKENRAQQLDPVEQMERFNHFKRQREIKLALVVAQEDRTILQYKARDQNNSRNFQKLGHTFHTRLEQEEKALTAMDRARAKYERVLEHDNHGVVERRQTAMARQALMENRHAIIDAMKAASVKQLKKKGRERAALIKKNVEASRKQKAIKTGKLRKAQEERLAQVNEFIEQKKKNVKSTASKTKMVQERNKKAAEEKLVAQELERQETKAKYHRKEKHLQKLRTQREREKEQKKLERQLDMAIRMQKAERIRKAKLYKRQRLIDNINNETKRMEQVKEMRAAIADERRNIMRMEKIRRDDWRNSNRVERDITPGPGAYEIGSTLKNTGGAWGKFTPKSEWDWIELNGALTPGPGQYSNGRSTLKKSGGVISEFRPKTDVEISMARAAAIPGPGYYKPKQVQSKAGATFGNFNPKSELDVLIDTAKELPGPGQYDKPMPRLRKPTLDDLKRHFNMSTVAKLKQIAGKTRRRLSSSSPTQQDFIQTV